MQKVKLIETDCKFKPGDLVRSKDSPEVYIIESIEDGEIICYTKRYKSFMLAPKITKNGILRQVANILYDDEEHGVCLIKSNKRDHDIVLSRHIAIYILTANGFGCADLGRFLKKDHSSIIYAVRTVKEKISIGDKEYMALLEKVNRLLPEQHKQKQQQFCDEILC